MSLIMLFPLFSINSLTKADAVEYEELGEIHFGSVEMTLTELVENNFKVSIPVTLVPMNYNHIHNENEFCWFEYAGYLRDGLSFYSGGTYNEEVNGFFNYCWPDYYESLVDRNYRIGTITVNVPTSAKAGDKYTVDASLYSLTGGRLQWVVPSINNSSKYYYYTKAVDATISIKSDPITADDDFSTGFIGNGTKESPYLISTADDLVHFSELINNTKTNPYCRNAYYKQTADIDMKGIDFTPIGRFYDTDNYTVTENAVFSGNYDGGKHKITNLKIKSYYKYSGLFGRIGESSDTENECKVHHLSVYGEVSSSNSVVGGIVGEIGYGASVVNCSFHGNISGADIVGGIAGRIYEGGNINYSYFTGDVLSSDLCSGIVASVDIGNSSKSKSVAINSCYTNGSLNGSEPYAIISKYNINNSSAVSISLNNNYYSSSTSENGTPDNLVGCTRLSDNALKACADILADEYSPDLDMMNNGFPVFEWELAPYQFKGDGTLDSPYQISTKEDLYGLSRNIAVYPDYNTAFYIQTNDIDLENEEFYPIGIQQNNSYGRSFMGCYDGNCHSIKNMNIDYNNTLSCGLFAYTDKNALIKDLVVYGNVHSKGAAGGLIGSAQRTYIENCAFIGNVSSATKEAGGLIGNGNFLGEISINNCYHNGSVEGCTYASGIIGSSGYADESNSFEISNSYHANGKIVCDTKENSYGIMAVNMTWLNQLYSDAENHIPAIYVSNCYISTGNASNTSCPYAKSDNTTALIQSQMKQIAQDLGDAFVTNTDESLNNGYPVFKWQLSKIKGDVNADGQFNIADVVIFQKWLLAVPNTKLSDWQAVDYTSDNRLNVFDFCLMKYELINQYKING